MEITIEQLKQLYENGKTNNNEMKRIVLTPWVNMPNKEHSYCDIIFKYKRKKYMFVIKHSILDKDNDEKIKCIDMSS